MVLDEHRFLHNVQTAAEYCVREGEGVRDGAWQGKGVREEASEDKGVSEGGVEGRETRANDGAEAGAAHPVLSRGHIAARTPLPAELRQAVDVLDVYRIDNWPKLALRQT